MLKPSLRAPWLRQWLVPLRELGTRVARIGPWGVWSPVEDVTMRLGGPRSGKSGEIAGRILDAPGAAIATSTRTDLYRVTAPLRERVGPVYVFNPGGLADLPSTITFDPLAGCEHATTAQARAFDLLSGGPDSGESNSEREYWITLGRSALAALMHAAAIGRRGMPRGAGLAGRPAVARRPDPAAAAPLDGADVRGRRPPVPGDQRPHPVQHHHHDHARARVAAEPDRGRRGPRHPHRLTRWWPGRRSGG